MSGLGAGNYVLEGAVVCKLADTSISVVCKLFF